MKVQALYKSCGVLARVAYFVRKGGRLSDLAPSVERLAELFRLDPMQKDDRQPVRIKCKISGICLEIRTTVHMREHFAVAPK